MPRKPKLAVWKFASCDGCQLSLLDCEDELLPLFARVRVADFREASRRVMPGPYDISLVEGSITTRADVERIQRIRERSKWLVTIGACATAGGIQALRNFRDLGNLARVAYPRPDYLDTLATSTPIAAHVPVDAELPGCPIDKRQLLQFLQSLLLGKRLRVAASSVCLECKRRGNVCVMVAQGVPCLGPVTRAGCGGLCPSYARGCYGCFGPQASTNAPSLSRQWSTLGVAGADLVRAYRSFQAGAEPFAEESRRHEDETNPRRIPGTRRG